MLGQKTISSELTTQGIRERQDRLRRALISTVITLAVMGLYWLIIMPPQFTDTNDDAIMAAFSYGYMGEASVYLAYINILVGYLLKGLRLLTPVLPWYFLVQMVLVICSSSVIGYLIMARFQGCKAILPMAFFFLSCSEERGRSL